MRCGAVLRNSDTNSMSIRCSLLKYSSCTLSPKIVRLYKSPSRRYTTTSPSMSNSLISYTHSLVSDLDTLPSRFITHKFATSSLSLKKKIISCNLPEVDVFGLQAPRTPHVDSGVRFFASGCESPGLGAHQLHILDCSPPSYRFVSLVCRKGTKT